MTQFWSFGHFYGLKDMVMKNLSYLLHIKELFSQVG